MNSAEETSPLDGEKKVETALETSSSAVAREDSMAEYRQLKLELYITTLAIALVVFATVAFVRDLPTAFNYLLGAVASLVYLRMLAKDVDRLGGDNQRLSWNRTALFVGLMVVAAKWHQLQVLPIFLGFLTYKAALLIYLIRTTLLTNLRSS